MASSFQFRNVNTYVVEPEGEPIQSLPSKSSLDFSPQSSCIEEAPDDGNQYTRQSKSWQEVVIPVNTSDLNNDSGFITDSSLTKENIVGLKIADSPEFSDTQITSLAAEATYTPTVWAYLVSLFTSVPKSVKEHIVKIWERLQLIEDNVVLDYTAENAITSLTLTQDKNGNALNLVDFDVIVYGENVDSFNNALLTVNNNTTLICYNGVLQATRTEFFIYLRGQLNKKFEGQLIFRKIGCLYAFHQITNDTTVAGVSRSNNYGGSITSNIGNITRLDFTSINWKAGTRIKIIRR